MIQKGVVVDPEGLVDDHLANNPQPVAVAVFAGGLLEDAVGVDVGELDADRGIGPIAGDADLPHLRRPLPHLRGHRLHFPPSQRRGDRAVVQVRQPLGRHSP